MVFYFIFANIQPSANNSEICPRKWWITSSLIKHSCCPQETKREREKMYVYEIDEEAKMNYFNNQHALLLLYVQKFPRLPFNMPFSFLTPLNKYFICKKTINSSFNHIIYSQYNFNFIGSHDGRDGEVRNWVETREYKAQIICVGGRERESGIIYNLMHSSWEALKSIFALYLLGEKNSSELFKWRKKVAKSKLKVFS